MHRLLRPVLAGLLALVIAAPVHAAVYGAESFMLANGMQVVVVPNHRAPVVSLMVWYKNGAADDPLGKSGIAHFLEHLMFKGTPRYSAGAITDIVARHGGQQNAFTSHDYTAYFENVAVEHLPLMMDIEADRMRNLVLDKKGVDTEREVIIEERRMRTDNVPRAILQERMAAALWMTNHYGIPVIGWEAEMRGLTQKDALDYYNKYYAPNNAILIVGGDVTVDSLKPLAEKYFGVLAPAKNWKGKSPKRERPTFLYHPASMHITMKHEQVSQPEWSRETIAPSYNVGDLSEVHALEVLSQIMGSGSTSKLYRKLVIEQQVAAGFSASYDGETVSYGTFFVGITPAPGVAPEKAEAAYDAALADLLKEGITDADVALAKQRLNAQLAFAKDSPISAAQQVGSSLTVGLTLDQVENWPDAIAKVTTDDVRKAARKLFTQSASVTGTLLPEDDAQGGVK